VKHYITEVVADEVAFADGKKDEGAAAPAGGQQQQKASDNPPQNGGQNQGQAPGGPFNPVNFQQPPSGEPPKRMPWDKKPGEA
jgi:single-stranded DNA-binding protein